MSLIFFVFITFIVETIYGSIKVYFLLKSKI